MKVLGWVLAGVMWAAPLLFALVGVSFAFKGPFCGLDCGAWAVQLGGEPACEDCRRLADGNTTDGKDT